MLYKINGKITNILGEKRGNKIEAFWFIKVRNAGDLVTPFLLKKYGFTPVHRWPPQARVIGCGSLLRYLSEDYDGYILGSGFLRDGPALILPKAKVLAIRGTKSRDRIGAPVSTILGDPGLLMAKFFNFNLPKKYTLGILPHYTDKSDKRMKKILQRYPRETHFIDIQSTPLSVMREISQCQYILSSSLHGCIFADALKIPVIWLSVPGRENERDYKFLDYSSVFSRKLIPTIISEDDSLSQILLHALPLPSGEVDEVINNLDQAFLKLKNDLLENR